MARIHNKHFVQVATEGKQSWLEIYQRGNVNSYERIAGPASLWLFYLGDNRDGQLASDIYSRYQENEHSRLKSYPTMMTLFRACLYRSLAQKNEEALKLWQLFVNMRHKTFSISYLLNQKRAEYLVMEAYALAKMGKYQDSILVTREGIKYIEKGYTLYQPFSEDPLIYGLPTLLLSLSDYHLFPNSESKQNAQQQLLAYKNLKAKGKKSGYAVVFDMQFSYPDVFDPVLPGPNPDKD
jgi:hypothetical protein